MLLTIMVDSLPDTTNNLYFSVSRTVGGKRKEFRVLKKPAKAWKAEVAEAIRAWRETHQVDPDTIDTLRVSILFEGPSVYTYDVDGRAKLPLDALAEGLGRDDRYVTDLRLHKRRATAPRCTIRAWVRFVKAPSPVRPTAAALRRTNATQPDLASDRRPSRSDTS